MSTEDLLVCVSSVELLCSAPSRTPTCLAHASYVQNQTQFSKILLVENENASTELFPTLSSPLLHVKDNRVLLPITNLQKQPGGFRKVKVPCATATPLHDHSPNAKSGSVTRNEKRKSDWIVWKTTTISLFCVFFVFFVAVDFYCLLYPEIYTHSPVKLKLGFQNHKKESRNNAVLLEDPCSSKKLHNVTRRVMTNRSVLQKNLPKHMKSNVFSPFDVLYSDKLEPRYLRPSESPYFMATSSIRGKDVLILKHNQDVVLKESKTVMKQMQNLSFILSPIAGLEVHIELVGVRLLPEYEDVAYTHSDNGIVLDTSRRSNMHHWRAPLQEVLNNWCRHPLPIQYYLTMHPYLDRHTTARRQTCINPMATGYNHIKPPLCPSNVPHKSTYFHRSINGQCTQNKASFLPPQRNSFYCTTNSPLVNIVFNERITERQSYLKDSHCDTQRRLCQTCLRRSCWRESAALNSSSDTWDQTLGDDLAQKWDLLGDASADFKRAKAKECCSVDCYSIPSCLEYFSPTCQAYTIHSQHVQEVCLQGKTLKFTLNPEFDLANGSFMCHLTRVPPENLYTINAWLVVNGTWKTDPVSHVVSLRPPNGIRDSRGAHSPQSMKHLRYRRAESSLNRNLRGVVLLWNDKLRVEHQSSASLWEQLILKRKNAPGQFYVYRLKSFEEFGLAPPQYEKHREEKYATVQFTTPFLHNTESWGNESCQLNISHMHKSQPIYDETSEIPIVLASPTRRNANGAFQYTLNEAQLGTKIQVTMEVENQDSLLRSALCIQNLRLSPMYKMTAKNQTDWFRRQIGHIINRVGMELKVTSRLINTELDTDRCERMESWRVSIEGWVTEKPAYLDLLVEKQIVPPQGTDNVESSASLPILKQDILLLPGLQQQTWNRPPNLKETQHPFLLEFDLTKITKGHPVANRTYTINIYLRDCVQNYHLETNLGDDYVSSASSQETDRPLVPVFSKPPERMWKLERLYLPFILICIVIGLLYLVLLTAYCFVRACSGTSKHSSVVAHHRATRTVPSVSMSSSTSLLSGATTELQSSEPMTAARKVLIMVYLCFRVFYTFLFTISVGLSLILSIESNSARDFTAALYSNTGYSFSHTNGRLPPRPSPYVVTPTEVESRWRESNSWMFEAARMEDFAHSELLRQTQIMNKQIVECGDQMSLSNLRLTEMMHLFGSQIRSWLNPKSETIGLLRFQADAPTEPVVGKGDVKAHDTQQMWATNPVYGNFLPLHRSTWKLLEQANWIPYLDTVDVHLQKIRDVLDTEVIDQWTPFDRLLNNLLVNNWIAPARRSMNTSWTRVGDAPTSETGLFGISDSEYYSENIDTSPSDPMNQKRQREARALKLANFIGVPQPAHARLSGARIWNSFRSQVFGLPTYFHYDISGNLNAGEGEPQKAKFSSMRYYDRRYMLSNEDWQHVSGGFLEGGRHTIQRHIQNAQTQMRLNVATTSGAYSSSNYFLSLTQVRLLLLLLDAVIILARCCQTYRFLQRFWFGKLKRVSMDALHAEVPLPLNNINESKGSAVRTSSEGNTLQTSYISDRNPLTWSDSDGYTPHIRDSSVPILGVEHIHQGIQQPDLKNYRQLRSTVSFGRTGNRPLPGLRHRSGDVGSYMDGSQGRLTACYCCLDSHYLLIIVGIGLLILGIVLLWVTDRHVRTGWLLARTGLIVRTGALEDCRLRTNSILKNAQTNYWNKQVRFVAREAFRRDAHRIKQMVRRIQHERLQIYQGYLSELCTVDRTRQNLHNVARKANPSSAYPPTMEAISMSEPTSCSLFDSSGQLKNSVQNHINEQFHGSNPRTEDGKLGHGFPQIPSCVFTPIVPATYAEGQSSRILRLTKSRDVLWRGNVSFVSATNQSKNSRFKSDDPLPEELGMALSTGSLALLLNACQRLILIGLTVTLAMVGFLACLQLAKFLAQRLLPIRTRKVLLVTTHPVHPANPSCFQTI